MKDKQAYSLLLNLAQAAGKEKEWKTALVIAAKNAVNQLNTQTFSNNRSTHAQDHAYCDATKLVSYFFIYSQNCDI